MYYKLKCIIKNIIKIKQKIDKPNRQHTVISETNIDSHKDRYTVYFGKAIDVSNFLLTTYTIKDDINKNLHAEIKT